NLAATNADVIAAANPGCAIQIGRYLERPLPILHPIELLARSLSGSATGARRRHGLLARVLGDRR
ncbi:MAG TPA: hypothetical protein VIX82_00470, partial [Solirubrobacteraceae bacterium]